MSNIRKVNNYFFILLGFSFPISIAIANIMITLITLLWLIEMDFKRKYKEFLSSKVAVAIFIFMLLHFVGLLWATDLHRGWHIVKYHYVLWLFPIFFTTIDSKYADKVIFAFLIAMIISVLGSYAMYFGLWDGVVNDWVDAAGTKIFYTPFIRHIVYAPILAITIFLMLNQLMYSTNSKLKKIVYTFFIITMSLNIFISGGRTGQMAFFTLLFIFALLYLKNHKKWMFSFIFAIPIVLITMYFLNETFQKRTNNAIDTFRYAKTNTSVAIRMKYIEYTLELISKNLVFGVGTGDFKRDYYAIVEPKKEHKYLVDHPHSEYLMAFAQHGIFGIVSLLFILVSMLMFTRQYNDDNARNIRYIIILFFSIIFMSDYFLYAFETQTLFVLLVAIFYKSYHHNPFGSLDKNKEQLLTEL